LYFSEGGQTHRVFQITSATPGDGKSTVAANLAVCIAQSGKRVLLMDADMRKPRQHEIFRISAQTGLASIIALGEELADTVQQTAVDKLWLLPAGPLPPDPSELLTSSRFPELISVLREQYDYVVVDTGPLLLVSDPSVVAARVDGVLMAVRLSKNSRRQTNQAKEILMSLDTKVVGVVVNGVGGARSRGYHYGTYGDYAGYHENSNGSSRPARISDVTTT
jgi:capsular exopolysaccharide synthesis family protein